MKKVVLSFITMMVIMLFTLTNLNAQSPPDCEIDNPLDSCGAWAPRGPGFKDITLSDECTLRVFFETRECKSGPQIRINNVQRIGVNCFSLSASTINELAVLSVLEGFGGPNNDAPDCNDSTVTTYDVFTSACIYESTCTYYFGQIDSVNCDPSFEEPDPATLAGMDSITVTKHLPCGEVCCRTPYQVCASGTDDFGNQIIRVTKGPSEAFGECTEPPAGIQGECIKLCGN
jgi:hypothetical protein